MPPAPTQNLNAKLTDPHYSGRAEGGRGLRTGAPSIHASALPALQGSAPPVRIVGAASGYRGGYHVSGR